MKRRLRGFLALRGADREEIARAEREGWLPLLTLDRMLMPGRPTHDLDAVAHLAGADPATARRIWRALGFPDTPPDLPAFSDAHVEALATLTSARYGAAAFGDEPEESLLAQIRILSAGLARLAEMEADRIARALQDGRAAGMDDEGLALAAVDSFDWPTVAELVDFAHRIQLRAALWRQLAGGEPAGAGAPIRCIGFVDLSGYTALSRRLDPEALTALVARFEELAYDSVAEHGGRVVKTIGDEVMFVTGEPAAGVTITLDLVRRAAEDDVLPEAKAGLAAGPVLVREGDCFGPVVNVASRLAEGARAGTILVADSVRAALADDESLTWRRVRLRRPRDVGPEAVWSLTVTGEPVPRD
ncbi:MAG: adenylate/guanylate cyclase domain-containing protein [Acidimicrobiia bacterium]|nr:adenylate/guanylate cyclase domain-containing protein [Acidimicrobiia bacterium]